MSHLASLHLNSEYSLLQSTIKLDKLFEFAKKHNLQSLVLTDHNVMSGVSEFIAKCHINNIKPIVGLDLDVDDFRLILLAKNYQGYQHLIKLSSQKMHHKIISLEQIDPQNLFIIDHPTYGYYQKYHQVLTLKNFYVGSSKILELENTVFVNDTRILESTSENEILTILNQIATNEKKSFSLKPYPLNLDRNRDDVKKVLDIVEQCNVDFSHIKLKVPQFSNDNNFNPFDYLKALVEKGVEKNLKPQKLSIALMNKYYERIKHELIIINKLNFADYFLIIHDIVAFAKDNKILVGPGRGSVAGSLIAYLLNITEVDPLKFDLLFERFLNPERVTMPDIDLDFQDNLREEIIDYIFKKYGLKNVGLISTFQRLGPKMALRDVGRNMGLHLSEVDVITKTIPNLVNAPYINSLTGIYENVSQFRAMIDKKSVYSELFKKAQLIEGLPRQSGTHAAGIVISNQSLDEVAPTIIGPNNLNQIQFPMDYLEQQGLLKIDILGLRNLTILQNIQDEVQKNHNHRINLQQIPLNDKITNQLLSGGDTNGIFQLESYGMKKTITQTGIDSVDDVTAVISLYRPGPMDNIKLYIEGKKQTSSTKIDPSIDAILKTTYGIIVYQEQIMQIVEKFSGMNFGEADLFRRAIGKKDKNLLESLKEKFYLKSQQKGHDPKVIKQVYEYIAKFANFGFNKSHAVAYAILAYRLAYLKARFPIEFYTALLNSSLNSIEMIKIYLNEAKSKDIKIIGPEINLSKSLVYNQDHQIILPFTLIKGIGQTANLKILEARNSHKFKDLFDIFITLKLKNIGDAVIKLLINANAFRNFANMNTCLASMPILIRYASMIIVKVAGQKQVDKSLVKQPNLIEQPQNLSQEVESENSTLGLPINIFLTTPYESKIKLINLKLNQPIKLVVLLEKAYKFQTKQGEWMGNLVVSDSSSTKDVTVFPELWKKLKTKKTQKLYEIEIIKTTKNKLFQINLISEWKEIINE